MSWIIWLAIGGLVVAAIAAIAFYRSGQEEYDRTGKRPKGYYMGQGIAIGLAIGVGVGVALDNLALGPAIGLAIGTAMGASLEQRHADELRPRTAREEKTQRWMTAGLVVALLIGIAALLAVWLFARG